jgi:dethiobiotin synthetase
MNRGYFVAGTDTGVGKTLVATALIRGLVHRGLRVAAMKPVASGSTRTPLGLRNDDALALIAAANVAAPYERVNPFCFEPATSPHIAAKDAGIVIAMDVIRREYDALLAQSDCIVVEGAGGWLAPISQTATMEDVATMLGLPVVLVVGLRLGCLNHAQLTARAVRGAGLKVAHWVANEIGADFARRSENVAALTTALGPPLAVVPFAPQESGGRPTIDVSL